MVVADLHPTWYATPKKKKKTFLASPCTAAFFQVAPTVGSIRSNQVNLTYHLNMCNTLFGLVRTCFDVALCLTLPRQTSPPGVNATNTRYGANETAGSNIWFNDGSQDPWQQARYALLPHHPHLLSFTVCSAAPTRLSTTS